MKIKELGMNSAKVKGIVALITRNQKIDIADHLLKENWNQTLKEILQKLEIKLDINKTNSNQITPDNFDKIFRTQLKKSWKQNLKDNFVDIIEEKLIPLLNLTLSKAKQSKISSKPTHFAKESLNSAIKHLSERNSVFTEKKLISTSLKYGLGKTNLYHINQEIENLKTKEILITCLELGLDNHLATRDSLKTELKIIEFTKESLKPENYLKPIYEKDEAEELNNSPIFSSLKYKGQKKACNFILTSPQKIIAIQGYAGTGKTHMLKTTSKILATKNLEIFGLAPTGNAVKELENVGIKAKTLQWFLDIKYDGVADGRGTDEGRKKMKADFADKIVVVDESSLISSRQMQKLLTVREKLEFKLVLLGDTKQENAVEAGHPFYQMQKHHLATVTMDEIIRQKNEKLKISVYNTIKASDPRNLNQGYIKKAFANIDNIIEVKLDEIDKIGKTSTTTNAAKKESITARITDLEKIKHRMELIDKIAKTTASHYANLTKEERDQTLILTPANETRAKVNSYIRQNLKESGQLNSKSEIRKILINQSLEEAQKQNINAYQKNDIIKFNKSYKTNNIIQDRYYQITAKDIKRNNIYLTDQITKQQIVWNPAKIAGTRRGVVEIYKQETREFSIGEKINFTRGFTKYNIVNSEIAEIKNIPDKSIILKINNKEIEISKDNPILNHIDYGYGYTVHRAQGKTVDNVIAVLESYRISLTTQKSFYVEISRARHNATLIVDNKEEIITKLEKTTGEKISIVDLLNSKKSRLKINNETNKEESKNQNNHDHNKSAFTTKGAKDNNSLVQRARNTKQYLLPKLSTAEIKEHFISAIKDQTNINSTKLTLAIDKAFDQPNQKIRFGVKNSSELCWYGEAGYIKDYKNGEIFKWGIGNIKTDDYTKFKTIGRKELELKQQQASEQKQRIEQQKLEEKAAIAKKAVQYFNSYQESNRANASNNKYLINKNIIDAKNITGIKFTKDNQIVIPLTDTQNKIHSLQYINQDGSKKFLKGGEKQGNFFLITKDDANNKNLKQEKEIYLAEGFATAASIHQATNKPVAVCFDAGVMVHT